MDVHGKHPCACLHWRACGEASAGNREPEMGTSLGGGSLQVVCLWLLTLSHPCSEGHFPLYRVFLLVIATR